MFEPFITTQDLSDQLGVDVTDDDGATMAVEAACSLVYDVTEQHFNYGTSTVSFDGTGTDAILLPQYPARNCGTVVLAGTQGTITDYMLAEGNRLLRGTAGYGWMGIRPIWPRGRQNVIVTYEHGFEPQEIPKAIKLVAIQVASRMVVQGVASAETIGDVSITYASNGELTAVEERILNFWTRRRSW